MSTINPEIFGGMTVGQARRVASTSAPAALPELLHGAIRAERLDLLRLLLEEIGIDPNMPTPYGFTALHVAVEHYQPEMVRYLCARGADPSARKPGGWTPLHLAVDIEADSARQEDREPSVGLIRLLLQAGADPTLADDDGMTAGALAVAWRHEAAAHLLAG